jgi:KDO2-lipid IV(A) lauroyltransferase
MTALALAIRVPRGPRRALGRWLGDVAWCLWSSGRARAESSLRIALGDAAPSSRDVLRGLGETLADMVGLVAGEPPALALDADDEARLRGALGERGVVFATAHLGPWEAIGPVLASRGLRVATIARESYDPRFDRLYARLRDDRGVRALYRGAPGFATALVRALRTGTIVGFPMDLAGRGVRTIDAPWMGRRAPIPVGPAELALRTGAQVVIGTAAPGPHGARLAIEVLPTGDSDAADLTSRIAEALSARILAMPRQFPWMSRDLATLPPGIAQSCARIASLDLEFPGRRTGSSWRSICARPFRE